MSVGEQHIGDARIEMEEALTAPATVSVTAAAIPARTVWRRAIPLVLAAGIAAIIASITVWNLRPVPTPQSLTRLNVTLAPTEQLGAGNYGLLVPVVALSPDGKHLAYIANEQLYLRAMDRLEASPFPGTEGALMPFFSPDGQWIGFFADNELKKVSVNGGAPLTLCDAPAPRGGSWETDDTIAFGTASTGLVRVSAAGGTSQELTTLEEGEDFHGLPHFLPGGKAVLFTNVIGSDIAGAIEVLVMETGERRVLVQKGFQAHYVPTGHLVYAQVGAPGTLMAVPFDVERLEVTGDPVPILEGVLQQTGYAAQFSLSHQGTLVYVPGGTQGNENTLVLVDRTGAVEPLGASSRLYRQPALSPDGRRLAVSIQGEPYDVWVYDILRTTLTRLTFEGDNRVPLWTPDGERIAFSLHEGGRPRESVLEAGGRQRRGGASGNQQTDPES